MDDFISNVPHVGNHPTVLCFKIRAIRKSVKSWSGQLRIFAKHHRSEAATIPILKSSEWWFRYPHPIRMAMRIIFSIKPEYPAKIFSGEKQVEYRRRPIRNAEKVIVYVTKPVGKVLGEFEVEELLCLDPERLWEETGEVGEISEEAFFIYFKDSPQAYALAIRNVVKYEEERELADYGLKHAPQFFAYVRKKLHRRVMKLLC